MGIEDGWFLLCKVCAWEPDMLGTYTQAVTEARAHEQREKIAPTQEQPPFPPCGVCGKPSHSVTTHEYQPTGGWDAFWDKKSAPTQVSTSDHVSHEHQQHYGHWDDEGTEWQSWVPTSSYVLKHSHEKGDEPHEHS